MNKLAESVTNVFRGGTGKLDPKGILMVVLGILIVGLVAVNLLNRPEEKPPPGFQELAEIDLEEVAYLVLTEGSMGEEVEVREKALVQEFFELVGSLGFQREKDQGQRPALHYRVDLHRRGEGHLRVVFAGPLVYFQDFMVGEGGGQVSRPSPYYRVDRDIQEQLGSLFAAAVLALGEEEEEEEEEPEPATVIVQELYPAISVVIDNNTASRPSSGLQGADYVYEFLVEGGSTRYLAVFQRLHEENFTIGPIRSLRPYFAVQSLEHGGIVAHSGYSARTAGMIRGLGIYQIGDYGHFWRDSSRRAPHNLYTNINSLYQAAGDRPQVREREMTLGWEVHESHQAHQGEAAIQVNYSAANRVHYQYDPGEEVYLRYINGRPHTDLDSGEQYYAHRVILRENAHRDVPGGQGLVDITLEGSGKGRLYQGGLEYQVTWERQGDETLYRYPGGEPVQPIKGTTWIQVIR